MHWVITCRGKGLSSLWHQGNTWAGVPGGRFNIKMPSYQYRDSHVKDKTVSPTVLSLTWESPYMGKMVFILNRAPGDWCWTAQGPALEQQSDAVAIFSTNDSTASNDFWPKVSRQRQIAVIIRASRTHRASHRISHVGWVAGHTMYGINCGSNTGAPRGHTIVYHTPGHWMIPLMIQYVYTSIWSIKTVSCCDRYVPMHVGVAYVSVIGILLVLFL